MSMTSSGPLGDRPPHRQPAGDIDVDMVHAFQRDRALVADLGDRLHRSRPVEHAAARHAAIGLRDVDIAEIGRGRLEAGGKALLLDMHVVGVEMDEDVVRADPLDDLRGVAAAC